MVVIKGKGYASALLKEGMQILERDAKKNSKNYLDYIFCEINKFCNGIPPSAYIINNLGFKLLDIAYTQPPLSIEKNASDDLHLAVWSRNKTCIATDDIKLFIKIFFTKAFNIPHSTKDYYIDLLYERLKDTDFVKLLSIINE